MRLSEAIRLGSLAIQNPHAYDPNTCAIGMGLAAVGKLVPVAPIECDTFVHPVHAAFRAEWPWVREIFSGWDAKLLPINSVVGTYEAEIFSTFDQMVSRGRMTLEALCDQVRAWEDELAAEGINVEQATMAAELNQPGCPTQSIEKVLELDGVATPRGGE